jgi:5-methyltetrahydrofolate--homocysteine methyltransferase
VFYADDAFTGLHLMDDLTTGNGAREKRLQEGRTRKEFAKTTMIAGAESSTSTERSPVVQPPPNIPVPPFYGVRVRKDFDLNEVYKYINHTALFKNQWQLKTASQADYLRIVEEKYVPVLNCKKKWSRKAGLSPRSCTATLAAILKATMFCCMTCRKFGT